MKPPKLPEEKPSVPCKRQINPIVDLFSGSKPSAEIAAAHQQKFTGTDNPQEIRAIHFLMKGAMPRERLDKAVGCTNSPDFIFRMRFKGLEIPCEKVPDTDRDGLPICRGVFSLTCSDHQKINRWLATGQKDAIDLTLAVLLAFAGVCAVLFGVL